MSGNVIPIKEPNPTQMSMGRGRDPYGVFLTLFDKGRGDDLTSLPTFRMFDCIKYENCLDSAISCGWRNWKCHECPLANCQKLDPAPQGVNKRVSQEWLPMNVPGYPAYYVSNLGEISTKRRKVRKILSPVWITVSKGPIYKLSKEGKLRQFTLSELVLSAFLGEGMAEEIPSHINGDVADNRIDNLEWVVPHDE